MTVLNIAQHFRLFHVPRMLPGIASPVAGKKYQSLVAGGMHPFSRGSVHIQSKDPLAAPAIDPAYFRNPLDLDIIVSALKFLRRVATTEPLASTIIGEEVAPGPEVQTDKQLAEYCRKHFTTMSHPLGSASMLPKEDGGVVDANLIVYGTKNLRVVSGLCELINPVRSHASDRLMPPLFLSNCLPTLKPLFTLSRKRSVNVMNWGLKVTSCLL